MVFGRSLYSILIEKVSLSIFHWRPRDVPVHGFVVDRSIGVRLMVIGRGSLAGCDFRIISELDCTLHRFGSYLRNLSIPSFKRCNAASGVVSDARKSST